MGFPARLARARTIRDDDPKLVGEPIAFDRGDNPRLSIVGRAPHRAFHLSREQAGWLRMAAGSGASLTLGAIASLLVSEFLSTRPASARAVAVRTPVTVEPPSLPRPRRTVLAIGAHPDDIELGCGATLSRYHAIGYATRAIVLTQGEIGRGAERARGGLRSNEARDAAGVLEIDSLELHDFPDGQLAAHGHGVRRAIEQEVQRLRPDIVLTHSPLDRHLDHRQVFEATNEACRHVPTLMCYENPNTPAEFRPNVFIDVAPYIERKLAALVCHFSQSDKPYFAPELIRSIARVRGNQAQLAFAEGFFAIRVQPEAL